jgi:tetratricopeptide (TPR) repeat protein
MINVHVGNRKIYHNLPHPDYVEFIGRKQELAEVQRLLSPQNRAWVIVIDGIGGIGKSALALEAAYRYLPPAMRRGRGRVDETANLPPDLYAQVKHTLLHCRQFDDASALLALFVDARLSQWRTAIPTTAATLEQRVLAVIGALYDCHNAAGDNALALLLHVLRDQFSSQDAQYQQLTTLVEAVAQILQHADAVVAAPDIADEAFEAIVWVSAKNTVLTADGITRRASIFRALDDIYTAIAVALEYEAITRARLEEQDEVVRRALTRQRTLLIVDNLETVDDDRVMAFLRELPPPTKAIVTTRHRIDVAYPIRLTGMPEEDGLALIAHEAEKKGVTLTAEQFDLLFRRTGGIPLAIVWSVAQMGYGYGVEAVLRKLGEPAGDVTRFIFEAALERIHGKPAYTLLLALSLFATDASREALGYVADLPELDRDEGLVELEKLSLVNREGGRFSMMAITKGYVSNLARVFPYLSNLEQKWIDYFIKQSNQYSDKYWNWTNYDWLLAEGKNLLALFKWAISTDQPEIALKFYQAIQRYLDIEGRWTELVEYGELLCKVAQSLNAREALAWIYAHWLSWIYGEQEKIVLGEQAAKKAILLYQEIGDRKGECLALGYLSRVLRKSGELEISRQLIQKMLVFAQQINYNDGLASAYDQLGKIERDLKNWHDAKHYFEKARDLCESENTNFDQSVLMNILGNLGWVNFNLGDYESGKKLCERSFGFFVSIGGKGYLTSLKNQLAVIELALGNTQQAMQYAEEASYWASRLNIPRDMARAQEILGKIKG